MRTIIVGSSIVVAIALCLPLANGDDKEQSNEVKVRHQPEKNLAAWWVAETANFCILHDRDKQFAEKVANRIEKIRWEQTKKWLTPNDEDPENWRPRCIVRVHTSIKSFAKRTGTEGNGATTIRRYVQTQPECEIDVVDNDQLFDYVLPHEITHAILGITLNGSVPRWIDEGAAILSEPRNGIERRCKHLAKYRDNKELFETGTLLILEEYPKKRGECEVFYAQAASLVGFLATLKDEKTVVEFARDGERTSYRKALKKHYGIGEVAELDDQWRQFAFPDN